MSGNLTTDPKLVDVEGRAICEMRLAVDNGRRPSTYIDVHAFDEQAYACAEYLRKGSKVGVSGRLAFDEWRDAEGKKRSNYSVIGRVEFLDPCSGQGRGTAWGRVKPALRRSCCLIPRFGDLRRRGPP